eukprot:54775_1
MESLKAMSSDNKRILLCMSTFIGSHTIMSHHTIREKLIGVVGSDKAFAGIYSLITFACLVPAGYTYFKQTKGTGEDIPFLAENKALFIKMGILLAFKAAFMIPLLGSGKFATDPGMTQKQREAFVKDGKSIRGIIRVLRHPLFCAIGLASMSQILIGQKYSDLFFWGPMVFECIFGSLHQEQRLRQLYSPKYFENTSWIPHLAILQGKQSFSKVVEEIGYAKFAIGAVFGALTAYYYRNT